MKLVVITSKIIFEGSCADNFIWIKSFYLSTFRKRTAISVLAPKFLFGHKNFGATQCSSVFIQVRHICFTGSLRVGGGTLFKVGEHKCTSKKF